MVHSNPIQLLINEYYFSKDDNNIPGPHGYIELVTKSNPSDYRGKSLPFEGYNLIIGKRKGNKEILKIEAIVKLSNMVFTRNNFLLITTKVIPRIQNPDVNVMTMGANVLFPSGTDDQNVLDLSDDELIVMYLTYGLTNFDELTPQGKIRKVIVTEELLSNLENEIVDGLIFGNPKSSTPRKVMDLMNKEKKGIYMTKRIFQDTSLSFSRCTSASNIEPFQSNGFKVDTSSYLFNLTFSLVTKNDHSVRMISH